eukprot:scaffold57187_cov70-Phaeocystis_antarctica.AAC.5
MDLPVLVVDRINGTRCARAAVDICAPARKFPSLHGSPIGTEHVHAFTSEVGYKQVAMSRRHTVRLAETAETLALVAKLAHVDSIEREDLDAPIERVAHKELISLHRQSLGEGELALPFALLAKSEQKLKPQVKGDDAAVEDVNHKDDPGSDCDAFRALELLRSGALCEPERAFAE